MSRFEMLPVLPCRCCRKPNGTQKNAFDAPNLVAFMRTVLAGNRRRGNVQPMFGFVCDAVTGRFSTTSTPCVGRRYVSLAGGEPVVGAFVGNATLRTNTGSLVRVDS